MRDARFQEITSRYPRLCIAVAGDFCLDRYLEIDPEKNETSIETGLEVYNVVKVRGQPGAAGTILNNLAALGIGKILPVGFCGEDGEGFELLAALKARPNVSLEYFLQTPERRTFTYCKPLIVRAGGSHKELNRLDSKNWSPTPESVRRPLRESLRAVAAMSDAVILMDQVDLPDTGVVTADLLDTIRSMADAKPELLMIGDSRRSLRGWPSVCLKMNGRELAALTGINAGALDQVQTSAVSLARACGRPVFVTLSERGIVGASPDGECEHVPALPCRGQIDIVGAGDAVTANLAAALVAGATPREALDLAMAASSVVIHQLGTTGVASVADLRRALEM